VLGQVAKRISPLEPPPVTQPPGMPTGRPGLHAP
jgi:hypothetical protein